MNKRILVLGNNTEDTDLKTTNLAESNKSVNHGLIDISNCDNNGYYHTTLVDTPPADILMLAKKFDEIILLDQPQSDYTSPKILLSTLKLLRNIDLDTTLDIVTTYKENKNIKTLNYWIDMFDNNKSFCVYPWILYNNDRGYLSSCARSDLKITEESSDLDWKNNPEYVKLRNKMLKGERLYDNCKKCYDYEDRGLDSYRKHDSLDYLAILNINSIDDLNKITDPYFYEIRLSNKCNLMCRMCTPIYSHLLADEFNEHPELVTKFQTSSQATVYTNIDVIRYNTLTEKHTVYLTGGEPTIMKQVYNFMQKCIDHKKTDFQLTIGSNMQFLSSKFLNLAKHFKNLHFSVSIDGFGKTNDYIRWLSNFDTIMKNVDLVVDQGHRISWNHVPTIWGIHKTHELFEYVSERYPFVPLYLQYNRVRISDSYSSPLIEETIKSMERCMKTKVYFNDGKDCQSGINSFYNHYKNATVDKQQLRDFFEYNDKMDKARGIKLKDYIPELDKTRELLDDIVIDTI